MNVIYYLSNVEGTIYKCLKFVLLNASIPKVKGINLHLFPKKIISTRQLELMEYQTTTIKTITKIETRTLRS